MVKLGLQKIRKIRLERVKELCRLGINPYPSKLEKEPEAIKSARSLLGKKTAVAGRMTALREHGNVVFGDLKDESDQIQLFFQRY